MDKLLALVGGRVITPLQTMDPGIVLTAGRQIVAVGPVGCVPIPPTALVVDVAGRWVCPGFVELHIHGYRGVDLGSVASSPISPTGTVVGDALAVAARLPEAGVTSFLATLLGARTWDLLLQSMADVAAAARQAMAGAEMLGIHMEGPYLNPAPKGPYDCWPPGGAIPADLIRTPDRRELEAMIEAAQGHLRMMSLSPEIPGALDLIRQLARNGIVASGAHSFANYGETMAAVEAGMRTVTHLYNGMRHQDHREPGIIEAALACDAITAQVICDGVHVHRSALEIALRCKGVERLAVTTDNVAYTGLPDGIYVDRGRRLAKTADCATIGEGRLFGSVMPMNRQLRILAHGLGWSPSDAVRMATLVPANLVGVADRKGSLEPGKDADIVVMDDDFDVCLTLCRGEIAFRKGAGNP